jgi:ABC-type uncharacterized transport system substrate-binding protein
LRYFCSPQHTDSALYPIIGQMERAAGSAHDDTPQARLDKLDALLTQTSTSAQDAALFAEMLSLSNDGRYPALDLTPEQRRQRTLDALTAQMQALSRQNPVLMIFEDVHWTDPTSLEALGRAVDRLRTLSVLLVVTFRPEFESPWIGRPYVTALTVNRLAQRDIEAMIDHVVGNKLLPASVRQDIIERTDGIPLFVEEMTKAVLEAESEDEAQRTAAAVPSATLAVPASLHASLMARLDRLGSAKEVAQIYAQQRERMRRIGIVMPFAKGDSDGEARVRAFKQELAKLGWTDGSNIQFDEHWPADNMDLVRSQAASLVASNPDIIIASGGRIVPVLMRLTRSIPMVLPGASDPIGVGWAQSLARPGGNVTGFTGFELSTLGKSLEILKQIAPAVVRVALIYNPDNPNSVHYRHISEGVSARLAIETVDHPIHGLDDIDRAVASLADRGNGGIFFLPDITTNKLREDVVALVARRRVPANLFGREDWRAGVLRTRSDGLVSPLRRLRRSHFARRKACGYAVPAADEIRADDQPQNCQGAGDHSTSSVADDRRRGDRMR